MGNSSGSGRSCFRSGAAFKCVVIGETGSGKTSFLNLIGNLGSVVKLGADAELTKDMVRHLHREAQTEAANAALSKSQTKKAHAHRVRGLDFDLTVIDTPGFGDTEGLEEDQRHVASIVSAVEEQRAVNCIVLVINGRVPRVTPQLRYVLANVCAIMPKKILRQVIVVFTQVKDPDDDLLFKPEALEEYFGYKLPEDHLVYIDNPYAKVANLIEKGSRDEKKKLRLIKADFDTVTSDLETLFQKIHSFKPVETNVFKELFDTKQNIDKVAMQLNQELENILAERARAEQMKTALQDVTKAKEAYSEFETSKEVEEWTFEETPGLHHMVCSQCKKTCHHGCKIEKAIDKVMVFKNCQCFQVKTRKEIKVDNEGHRSQLLNAVSDVKCRFVDTEEDRATSDYETRAAIEINETINGTLVRGRPETTWVNNRFATYALCNDKGTTRDTLSTKKVPFTVAFSDWSGVERGDGMPCTCCGHSLSVHTHQTCQYKKIRKTETHVDEHMRAKFSQLNSDEEKQKLALDAVNKKLRDLEEKEKDLKKRLKDNLANFGRIAASSSYVSLLEEQKTYLEVLKRNASQAGKTQAVKALEEQLAVIETLKADVDLGVANNVGETPAHGAASNGHADVLQLLGEAGVDLQAVDKQGRTPAHCAAEDGHEACLRLLREAPPAAASSSSTATGLPTVVSQAEAVLRRQLEETREEAAMARQTAVEAESVLRRQLEEAQEEAAMARQTAVEAAPVGRRQLEEAGIDLTVDEDGFGPGHRAAEAGRAEDLRLLHEAGVHLGAADGNLRTPAHLAARTGNVACLKLLREAGVDLGAAGERLCTPAHVAAKGGHAAALQLLGEAGVDLGAADKAGSTPAYLAARHGHAAALKVLREAGVDLGAADKGGWTHAHWAVFNGHADVLQLVREAGVDLGAADLRGRTPAHLAALYGRAAALEVFREAGVDLGAADSDGWTPAYEAAFNGNPDVLQFLGKADVDLGVANNVGETPAHGAASNGHADVLQLLGKAGVDLGAANNDGRTPAHLAAEHGHAAALEVLRKAGVDLQAVDKQGKTPAHWAAEDGHEACLQLLRQAPPAAASSSASTATGLPTVISQAGPANYL